MISPFPDVNANPSPLESVTADAVPELLLLFLDAGAEPAELLGFRVMITSFLPQGTMDLTIPAISPIPLGVSMLDHFPR